MSDSNTEDNMSDYNSMFGVQDEAALEAMFQMKASPELMRALQLLLNPDIDNHGPLFMREYLGLLRDFTPLDVELLQEGARKHKTHLTI